MQGPHESGSTEQDSIEKVSNEQASNEQDALDKDSEEYWYKHVYQGDKVPQLTLRAVLMGGLLGAVLSISNLYTMIKVGWAFGVAITARPPNTTATWPHRISIRT